MNFKQQNATRLPSGEEVSHAGLALLLQAMGSVPIGAANRLGWPTQERGVAVTLDPLSSYDLTGSDRQSNPSPATDIGSNVVSIFRNKRQT